MQSTYEQYTIGCHMISLLTDLDVHFFDTQGVSHLHYARYDLPRVLERYTHEVLVHIFEQSLVKDHVYVFRSSMQFEFLAAGMWDGADYQGTLVVGPYIRKVYHPQMLEDMILQERLPLAMQRQLYQAYMTLTVVDDAKQHAISSLLVNVLTSEMRQPHLVETALPAKDNIAVKFAAALEQDQALIERRYESENMLLHAIAKGDAQGVKYVMEQAEGLPWPYRLPTSHVRSMKNLLITANSLFSRIFCAALSPYPATMYVAHTLDITQHPCSKILKIG